MRIPENARQPMSVTRATSLIFLLAICSGEAIASAKIGLTVGAGQYATEGIEAAEDQVACDFLMLPPDCGALLPPAKTPSETVDSLPPGVNGPAAGLVFSQGNIPDEITPESIAVAAEKIKTENNFAPDTPITASVYAAINEINAVNSNNQNAAQLCASLVKLSIGNQGN